MNVQSYVEESSNRNDYLTAKEVGKGVSGKILEVKAVKTPKFHGLFLTVKVKGNKYAFPLAFDRFDLGAVAAQIGSSETDDWLGHDVAFVTKKGTKKISGKFPVFVNVAQPKRKAAKKGKK